MNTKQIKYVIEASQTLNFNKAAENLFVSQPAFSYQIKSVEEEIGFKIFRRIGKSVQLTPAGKQFSRHLYHIQQELRDSIEEGQNFANKYNDNITIAYPLLSCLPNLPAVIHDFNVEYPHILITPQIGDSQAVSNFKNGDVDILFVSKPDIETMPEGKKNFLYHSKIYVLVNKKDPIAKKKILTSNDFNKHTLLVNGGSSKLLKKLQQKVVSDSKVKTLNSPNHQSTLVNVAAGKAVCLAPGFLKSYTPNVAWIPFQTDKNYDCYLITHHNDNRNVVQAFVKRIATKR